MNPLVMYEQEYHQILEVLERLVREANAKVVFLVDKDGQLIANAGQVAEMDTTSLASLTAGNMAATGGLAKLIGEKEFSILFHEGEKDSIHIKLVGTRVILVVVFDRRATAGLVRMRVNKCSTELEVIFDRLLKESASPTGQPLFGEISDDDIDSLFSDPVPRR
jgi:predicted regulator of Ras-like GTPase activity (Roadblock/LC7/MglB family)